MKAYVVIFIKCEIVTDELLVARESIKNVVYYFWIYENVLIVVRMYFA